MSISPIAYSSHSTSSPNLPPVIAAGNREVASAVQTLNQNGTAGRGREFSISIDGKTKLPVVRIVDSATSELIEQLPSQYILDLAQQIDKETSSNL
jgi:uncharacterized FlaG/YvyC family protein